MKKLTAEQQELWGIYYEAQNAVFRLQKFLGRAERLNTAEDEPQTFWTCSHCQERNYMLIPQVDLAKYASKIALRKIQKFKADWQSKYYGAGSKKPELSDCVRWLQEGK